MNYKFKLQGLKTPGGTISIRALQLFVDTLTETCERGLRLAVKVKALSVVQFQVGLRNRLILPSPE